LLSNDLVFEAHLSDWLGTQCVTPHLIDGLYLTEKGREKASFRVEMLRLLCRYGIHPSTNSAGGREVSTMMYVHISLCLGTCIKVVPRTRYS